MIDEFAYKKSLTEVYLRMFIDYALFYFFSEIIRARFGYLIKYYYEGGEIHGRAVLSRGTGQC